MLADVRFVLGLPPPSTKLKLASIAVSGAAFSKNDKLTSVVVTKPAYWALIVLFKSTKLPVEDVSQNISNKETVGFVSEIVKKGCIVIIAPEDPAALIVHIAPSWLLLFLEALTGSVSLVSNTLWPTLNSAK